MVKTFQGISPILNLHIGGQIIQSTHQHPFWVRGKGWTAANQLEAGDELSSHDGQWIAVDAVIDKGEDAVVYNVCVQEYHTYFVGGDSWVWSVWAHNMSSKNEGWFTRFTRWLGGKNTSKPSSTPKPTTPETSNQVGTRTEPIYGKEALDENGKIVPGEPAAGYHGISKTWDEIVEAGGLPAKPGKNLNLGDHVLGQKGDSPFRGIAPTGPGVGSVGQPNKVNPPVEFAGEGGTVVYIEGVLGWDAQLYAPRASSQLRRPEVEVAIMGEVSLSRIRRYGTVSLNRNGDEIVQPSDWHDNPFFGS